MPSDTGLPDHVTGRCYCGACSISGGPVLTSAYCHCTDCRRWTGAPVAAFAALATDCVQIPSHATLYTTDTGVTRWTCQTCGSPLACSFAYLPGQTYVPFGVLDQIDNVAPRLHSHAQNIVTWLHISDALPCQAGSARDRLIRRQ